MLRVVPHLQSKAAFTEVSGLYFAWSLVLKIVEKFNVRGWGEERNLRHGPASVGQLIVFVLTCSDHVAA